MNSWGRTAGAWPNLVHIVAIPPRPERRGLAKLLFVGWLLDVLSGDGWETLGSGDTGRPTRVVVQYDGRERLLFEESAFDTAKQKCERIAREFDAMDRQEWCRRYRVPDDFFS